MILKHLSTRFQVFTILIYIMTFCKLGHLYIIVISIITLDNKLGYVTFRRNNNMESLILNMFTLQDAGPLIAMSLLQQESRRTYGTADEALSTTLVMFKKMFLF